MLSVRIHPEDHKTLKELAERTDRPMSDLLSDAIKQLRRQFILEKTNSAYRELRSDRKAWAAELAERALWDAATIADADKDER
jgi:predicted transcriptional regulator